MAVAVASSGTAKPPARRSAHPDRRGGPRRRVSSRPAGVPGVDDADHHRSHILVSGDRRGQRGRGRVRAEVEDVVARPGQDVGEHRRTEPMQLAGRHRHEDDARVIVCGGGTGSPCGRRSRSPRRWPGAPGRSRSRRAPRRRRWRGGQGPGSRRRRPSARPRRPWPPRRPASFRRCRRRASAPRRRSAQGARRGAPGHGFSGVKP